VGTGRSDSAGLPAACSSDLTYLTDPTYLPHPPHLPRFWHALWFYASHMRRLIGSVFVVVGLLGSIACNEEGGITVHRLTFEGVNGVDVSRLKGALATRENVEVPLVGWELPWGRKNYFDQARFKADLQRIQAFYADRGYPDARVTGFDVKLNDKQDSAEIRVTIDEGMPVIVESVDFSGFEGVPPNHLQRLYEEMPLEIGKARDRQFVVQTHEMALNEMRDHGYPYAKIDTEEDGGPSGKSARIRFVAIPGLLAHFGPIEIVGNTTVGENVIARELRFRPGDLYRRSVLQDSQRRLYGLELFQFVNIEPTDREQRETQVPIRITVAEGNHQRVNFGVGYGTEEKARADIEYRHVNFLGAARSAGIHARWSSLDRGIRGEFTQPYFFARGFSLSAMAQQWYSYTPAYSSVISGGTASVTHRINRRTSWSLSLTAETNTSSVTEEYRNDPELVDDLIAIGLDPITGKQEGTLTAIGADFQHSTADNLLNARRGYQVTVHVEEAGPLLPGTFNYYAISAEGRHYLPLGDRLVLANRLQVGNIDAIEAGDVNVPFSKKFFLGGAATLRGWGRYEVSPLSDGIPIGGNSLFGFSSELRASIKGNFGAVLFLDAGNVWSDAWAMSLGDLRYAVGPGLRYQTPIGPVRFDIGYQLNPIPGLLVDGEPQARRLRFHFSIGQAF
jgi:outer membrane protein insertion porin family/translocation and assembly module TamA